MSGGDREQLVSIGGRRLRVTNLGKVMYPDTGTTKGEVIEYYTRIAPLMIPHVIGRPITRKRWVEGVGTDDEPGAVFFAKDLERGAPSWVARLPIPHSGGPKTYPLAADVPTLVYLAQVASLELHVPQWRFTADGSAATPIAWCSISTRARARGSASARSSQGGRAASCLTWGLRHIRSPAAARAFICMPRSLPARPANRPR
jgi:hypothetical protein